MKQWEDASFICDTSGLTKYRIYAYAGTNNSSYKEVSFQAQKPTLTTVSVSQSSTTTATAIGNISVLGNPSIIEHGHCCSTTSNPDITKSKTALGSIIATGQYSSDLTGLVVNSIYYVKAYATLMPGLFMARK